MSEQSIEDRLVWASGRGAHESYVTGTDEIIDALVKYGSRVDDVDAAR